MEAEKARLQIQLQQAQKMEAIGTLAGGIAHDFNNILAPIIGCTELSLDDASDNTFLYENLQQVLKAGMRAKDLVQQILTFSRQANQELKPLRVQTIIKEVLKLTRSTLPSTIQIQQHISNQCGLVMADATQIHQIAMNLITNAYHAMEQTGGKLEVMLKEVALTSDDLKNPDLMPGTYVCLTVTDTGIGMEKSIVDRIFDPYYTTKEKEKGTGLGLSVVHGIVKEFGGDISVHSEPGKGTVFHVYLPVIKAQAEAFEIETVEPVLKGTEKILLVDDEDQIIRMEKHMLAKLGYQVTAITSSIEALELFRKDPEHFDLIITDMTMPNMTGLKFSQKIFEKRPDIPIIICTGFSEAIDDHKVKHFGIRGYVMKPVVRRELARKIREALDKKD
jgi:nitrogen-specific signal transduction histidine kinase/ActR/RegA family two-component response regulator